jgi:3-hydroxyisobutyrate dehydrogenase-like beta-hydroxyacid dehydrogenase
MAGNLLDAGYPLRVYNRTVARTEDLVSRGALRASRAADAASPGGVVVSLLWDDDSVREVVTSDGFLERLGPGGVHLSMSTVSPAGSAELAALHERRGCLFVEAPIFGRPEAASARKLWVATAGPQAAKDRVRPLIEAMGAQGVFDFGETVGAAAMVKLVGNFLIISAASSMAESLAIVRKSGFDPDPVIDMLTQTLFTAPIYQTYGRMIAQRGAAVGQSDIPVKDLGLLTRTANEAASAAPIAELLLALRRPQA